MEISWESRINNGDSNPFNGNQTWLAGKSCINGGFNGNIICKCGFFSPWPCLISWIWIWIIQWIWIIIYQNLLIILIYHRSWISLLPNLQISEKCRIVPSLRIFPCGTPGTPNSYCWGSSKTSHFRDFQKATWHWFIIAYIT
jgi:hypothetical protein